MKKYFLYIIILLGLIPYTDSYSASFNSGSGCEEFVQCNISNSSFQFDNAIDEKDIDQNWNVLSNAYGYFIYVHNFGNTFLANSNCSISRYLLNAYIDLPPPCFCYNYS
ncbi:MAG: hypothetical protein MI739_07785 [Bacteroidales bacterium]|nr:hypothetical protein [Bacteroidales bacterium]